MRIIEPPRDQHASLKQPLTMGELRVLDILDRRLPGEWEIYIQPHLNGLKPDFVLLNPSVGVGVIEVKDWNLNAMRYYVKKHRSGRVELYATSPEGRDFRVENPFDKIRRYKEAIFGIYCPRLQEKKGFGAINGSLIFTQADRAQVQDLQKPFLSEAELKRRDEFWPIMGQKELNEGRVETVLPLLNRQGSSFMRPELADDLRGWLVEPDFAKMQRKPLEMDAKQRELSQTRTKSGYRRLKGAAGSGKSLVLAARAAKLVEEGKDVLIVTFNMTLWHYIKDLVSRARKGGKRAGLLTYTHFHKWCGDVCHFENKFSDEYAAIVLPLTKIRSANLHPKEEQRLLRPLLPQIMNVDVPRLAVQASRVLPYDEKFDAILVDEGQDYQPLWWDAIRAALRPEGEMLLVADASQDIYGSAQSWTENAMKGAGFSGEWATLDVSYRLPPKLLSLSQDFAKYFLSEDTRIIPQQESSELDIYPCELQWVQCDEQEVLSNCINAVLNLMKKTKLENGLGNSDIVLLCGSHDLGMQIVDKLEREPWGIYCTHIFAERKAEQNRRKMAFYLGQPRVKAATLHSFKGWESRMLVIHIGRAVTSEELAGVYTAITRLKRDHLGSYVIVVCSAPQLEAYGRSWPSFTTTCTYGADEA
ncbi:nuclease-related domain-containing DEAD/DEAH box helicase [Brucella rhizosphaerae]|uniref:nuclease-related domain-containing DEAD/DEAH box helicase n=1 Tax=Brucella rhizosphaerae TaxID=571254 RepID=UPI0004661A58|nr:NERD domain-containing protein/DEAD/DEAH box helicase [Brucella rhizosphaerae]